MLFGLLGALQTLHDAGEVHGAVSPGNILVLTDDRPVLLDTDAVARTLVGDQTRALMSMVNPAFAPQAAVAEPGASAAAVAVDGVAADLHALAAVAHFCISGTLPAAGEQPTPLPHVVRGLRLRASRPAYSAGLLDAIDAAVSDDPARRPASVAEFRAALSGPPDAARSVADEGPASAPAVALATVAPNTAATTPPAPIRPGSEPLRYPGRRKSQRLAWWGGGAMVALTIATISLVVVKERDAYTLRTDGFGVAPAPALAAPAALQAPTVTGRIGMPEAPAASVTTTASAVRAAAPTAPAQPLKAASAVVAVVVPAVHAASASAPARAPTRPPEPALPASPRAVCGARTEFALYRCMKTECARARWVSHAECERLRDTDSVD
jgi:hypothetical protein